MIEEKPIYSPRLATPSTKTASIQSNNSGLQTVKIDRAKNIYDFDIFCNPMINASAVGSRCPLQQLISDVRSTNMNLKSRKASRDT